MITNNQAKEAIKTIAEYCRQHTSEECKEGQCVLKEICLYTIVCDECPGDWPEYLEE